MQPTLNQEGAATSGVPRKPCRAEKVRSRNRSERRSGLRCRNEGRSGCRSRSSGTPIPHLEGQLLNLFTQDLELLTDGGLEALLLTGNSLDLLDN
ncbi:unnamed protein product [Merluccius merluccius]